MMSMKKILFVDDFDSIRNLVVQTLNNHGYLTVEAKNGKEAMDVLTNNAEDIGLIISDYNMPELNGLQLLKAVKENQATSDIPFFLLTTEKDPEKKMMAKKAGLTLWIKKPYQLNDFLGQVKNHLS